MNKKVAGSMLSLIAVLALLFAVGCKEKKVDEQEPAVESQSVGTSMDDDVKKGRDLFLSNGCVGCHGDSGHGDGPAGQALTPKPRNFHDKSAYKQGTSVDNIAKTIETGIPETAMVAYPHIPESDRRLIAHYIVFLQSQP